MQPIHEDAHLLLEQVVDLVSRVMPLAEGVLSVRISMTSTASCELVAAGHVTTSVAEGLGTKSGRQQVDLLLREVLEHFSSQTCILDGGDDGGYVHGIWLPRRRPWRLLACLRRSELLVLDELAEHVSRQVLDELWIHTHRDRLCDVRIERLHWLGWLLRWQLWGLLGRLSWLRLSLFARVRSLGLVRLWLRLQSLCTWLDLRWRILGDRLRLLLLWPCFHLALELSARDDHRLWLVACLTEAYDLRRGWQHGRLHLEVPAVLRRCLVPLTGR